MCRALCTLVLLACPLFAQVPIFSVPSSGFSSIQQAINAAPAQLAIIIEVAPGTYFERIDFRGKPITLRATVPGAVVLDGSQGGTVVTFNSGEGATSRLEGLVIRGGLGTASRPGGVYCGPGTAPVLSNCRIENNTGASPSGPGGVLALNASPSFFDCVISNNQGAEGGSGGIELRGGHPAGIRSIVVNTEISGNTGGPGTSAGNPPLSGAAGGMSIFGLVDFSMLGGSISGNSGGRGFNGLGSNAPAGAGGLEVRTSGASSVSFLNLRITANVGGSGAARANFTVAVPGAAGGLLIDAPRARFKNALIAGNRGGSVFPYLFVDRHPRCGVGGLQIGGLATSSLVFEHCTIADNRGGTRSPQRVSNGGPGGMIISGSPTFSHCIHQGNESGLSDGLNHTTPPVLVISGGATPSITWSNFSPSVPGAGNINEDPLFAQPNDGSYRLDMFSPCINRGDPSFIGIPGERDFEDEPRIQYGITDMGHDEFGNSGYLQPGTTTSDSLRLTINGSPWERHRVTPGDLTTIEVSGPGLANAPLLLVWQPFLGLPGPVAWPGLSEIHINPSIPYYFLYGPTNEAILGPANLSPTFTTTIPSPVALTGVFARLQAIAITSQAANGSHATSRGHDILYF